MSRAKSLVRLTQLIGVCMFLYILANLDISAVLKQLQQLRIEWLGVYVLFFMLSFSAKALRWNVVLEAQGTVLSIDKVLAIAIVASFIGLVTPGRVGEVSKIAYLREEHMSVARSAVSVVLDRLYDIAVLLVFGLIGLAYFSSFFLSHLNSFLVFFAVSVLLCLMVILFRRRLWNLLKVVTRRILAEDSYAAIADGWETFRTELKAVARPTAPAMLGYSMIAHVFFFGQLFVLALGFGVELPIVYLSLCAALSSLVALLPISIGGLGTREATFIALLGKISVSAESAVLISFSDGVVLGLSLAAFFAFIASMYLKLR
jgi:uncharacterized protein (TIRG00374 family)